jgi:hypothetical protein
MSNPTSFALLKRSNSYRYVFYEAADCVRRKSTRTRSKAEATKAPSNLKDLLNPKARVILSRITCIAGIDHPSVLPS